MEKEEILSFVDHTALAAFVTEEEIFNLCEDAIKYKTASVCIPPSYIKRVRERFPNLTICTVIGFPLGYSVTEAKVAEIECGIADGADEFDMVINISDAKNHYFDKITDEIKTLKNTCGNKVLKVIIETCYLTEQEKISLCGCVKEAKADYIKTSTGFGTKGATMDDISLFKTHVGKEVKINAAGGIRSKEDMEVFLAAGCSRLGTSSAIKILAGEVPNGY
jgi:deoxyribose-phosphate aldolase